MLEAARVFRTASWVLVHMGVVAMTACAPAAAIRPATTGASATTRSVAVTGAVTEAPGRCGPSGAAAAGYALRPGDWLPSLHTVGPSGGTDPRGSFAPWPEPGAAAPELAGAAIRLLVEEGRGAPRAVIAVRGAGEGYCVIGAWTTPDTDSTEIAVRDHWVSSDRSRFVALIEVVAHPLAHPSLTGADGEPSPQPDPQRSWVALASDGRRSWVAGEEGLERYVAPRLVARPSGVSIVDDDASPFREPREQRLGLLAPE